MYERMYTYIYIYVGIWILGFKIDVGFGHCSENTRFAWLHGRAGASRPESPFRRAASNGDSLSRGSIPNFL